MSFSRLSKTLCLSLSVLGAAGSTADYDPSKFAGGKIPTAVITPDGPWEYFESEGAFIPALPTFTFSGCALVRVTDAFLIGSQFDVYDISHKIGQTSVPDPSRLGQYVGGDFEAAFNDPGVSSGEFLVGPGDHEISMVEVVDPFPDAAGGGIRVISANCPNTDYSCDILCQELNSDAESYCKSWLLTPVCQGGNQNCAEPCNPTGANVESVTASPACDKYCRKLNGATSYCKAWQNPPVCLGADQDCSPANCDASGADAEPVTSSPACDALCQSRNGPTSYCMSWKNPPVCHGDNTPCSAPCEITNNDQNHL